MGHMRVYTVEFRQSAVNLVLLQGVSVRKAAQSLGVPFNTLQHWLTAARRGSSTLTVPVSSDPAIRVRELEAENRMLRIERDILKKAAQFFAREHL